MRPPGPEHAAAPALGNRGDEETSEGSARGQGYFAPVSTASTDSAPAELLRFGPVLPIHTAPGGRCSCGKPDCSSRGKHPRTANGLHGASEDLADIAGWADRWPGCNWGVVTGVRADVVDVDDWRAFFALLDALGVETTILGPVVTSGRGLHHYIAPTGQGNRAHLGGISLDLRGRGGYVVAPPSVHATGRVYSWVTEHPWSRPDAPLPAAPPWLINLLERPRIVPRGPGTRPAPVSDDEDPYWTAALERSAGRVVLAPVGARNDTLNMSAYGLGRLIGGGIGDVTEAAEVLLHVAALAGLGDDEAEATVASGLRGGRIKPRTFPRRLHRRESL